MPTIPSGKYQLRSLHEEIALFDRKLAHAQSHESFATEEERSSAVGKLTAKRSLLIRKAQQMIDEGIEFAESERPRSLRSSENITAGQTPVRPVAAQSTTPPEPAAVRISPESHFAGTALDYRAEFEDYKSGKAKRKTA
jgi:hypothetical protein